MEKIKIMVLSAIEFLTIASSVVFVSCNKKELANNSNLTQLNIKNNTKHREGDIYNKLNLNIAETTNTLSSNEFLKGLTQTNFIKNKLSSMGYSISDNYYTQVLDNYSGKFVYTLNLSSNTSGLVKKLIVVPLSDEQNKIYSVYVTSYVEINGVNKPSLVSLTSGHNPFLEPEGYKIGTQGWKDCIVASWGTLTNDLVGSLACATNPEICVAACVINCTGMIKHMTREEALKWLCDNGIIFCDGQLYLENSYTFASL